MSDGASPGRWNDLGARLLSGGLVAGVGLASVWIGGLFFHLIIAAISGIIVWELVRMIGAGAKAIPLGVASGLAAAIAMEIPDGFALPLLMAPAMFGVSQLDKHRITYALFTSAILLAGFGMVHVRDDLGFHWLVWLAMVVIVTDIAGYFAGRFIGGPKFWPKVSPKKTWSGTVAGWLGAAVVGYVYYLQGLGGVELVGISVAVSMAGQMGDIAESAVKRRMGVKDSSSILPGHGGLFDRFDAMLGASVFFLLIEQIALSPT